MVNVLILYHNVLSSNAFSGGNLIYSSPPPDLKGSSGIDVHNAHLWANQNYGILTDGSLGDINTKTVGTYGKC